MSYENHNATDNTSAGGGSAEGGAGGDDLNRALSDNGEAEFVSEGEAPKKNNNLVVFGLIIAALGGGYLLFKRGGPDAATAAAPAQDQTNKAVSSFLDGGGRNVELMQRMLRDTEKVVKQFLNYPSMKQVPLAELQTNPFRSRAAAKADGDGKAALNESEAAARKRREEERQAILKAVEGLNLQSVIHSGSRKACMVNNTLYAEGQQVDGFVIEKINPGSVVVKSGTYRFELKMQR